MGNHKRGVKQHSLSGELIAVFDNSLGEYQLIKKQ
jgi:hypothetical protein